MTESLIETFLAVDESLFYRLLEGPGSVQVDIVVVKGYFLPFVSFRACDDMPDVRYGLILRNGTDLLAAETVDALINLLRDMSGERRSLTINRPTLPRAPCATQAE